MINEDKEYYKTVTMIDKNTLVKALEIQKNLVIMRNKEWKGLKS